MTGRRTGRAAVVLMIASALATSAGTAVAASAPVDETLVTTDSTVAVGWTPRSPDDSAAASDPRTFDALKDWKLRVSQTQDLLNQTIQVSWTGAATTGTGTFVQLMQCWSQSPQVPPTREQCAYGGVDYVNAADIDATGSARTRKLTPDPRERTYRNDGQLDLVSVDGALATSTWTSAQQVQLGTNASKPCPAATTAYDLTLLPPRTDEGALPPLTVLTSTDPPASLTREENGYTRTYAAVTTPFSFDQVAAAHGVTAWPMGEYRAELRCLGAGPGGDAELARFVGFLVRKDSAGAPVWSRTSRDPGVSVPFDPLGDGPDEQATDPYDAQGVLEYVKPRTTNEVWQGLSRPDGAGSVFMEVLTDLEAQHLGCGRAQADGTPRSCWVVAVPRWTSEPSGGEINLIFAASPLAQTLWDRRIEVPLHFAPVASGCRIGSGLKQILTHDSAVAVLRSWQPSFCGEPATASSILGPLQDSSIRAGLGRANRMGIVGVPDPQAAAPTVVRAPVATSAVVIGFVVDRRIPYGSDDYARNATRATELNLTPRLVAKLLTQSYDHGAAPNGAKTEGYNSSVFSGGFVPTYTPPRRFPKDNPRTLYQDPEFLDLNPEFASWVGRGSLRPQDMADLLVATNDADAYRVLWQWVLSDPAASKFLAGEADEHGMLVNPYYQGQFTGESDTFPLLDPTCADLIQDPAGDRFPVLCQINNHPRVEDDTEAAQAGMRGDTKRVNVTPPVLTGDVADLTYKAELRQPQGSQAMIVVTTSGVAARFGMPTARLRNSSGSFTSPTDEAMSLARSQMTERQDDVLVPAPANVRDGAYPLTTMSYAVVDVAATTQAQNDAFAQILDYAAGPGQLPGTAIGQLPPGYTPLTPALAAQTRAAADLLRDPASLLAAAPGGPAGGTSASAPGTAATTGPAAPAPAALGQVGAPPGPGTPTTGAVAAAGPLPGAALAGATTDTISSALRWVLPAVLLAGLLGAVAGPLMSLLARRPVP